MLTMCPLWAYALCECIIDKENKLCRRQLSYSWTQWIIEMDKSNKTEIVYGKKKKEKCGNKEMAHGS